MSHQTDQRIQMVAGAQLVVGADGAYLIYNPVRTTYLRTSPLGAAVACLVDGRRTREEIVRELVSVAPQNEANLRRAMERFFAELGEAGLLLGADGSPTRESFLRRFRREPSIRLPVLRDVDVTRHLAWWKESVPARFRVLIGALGAVCAIALIAAAWSHRPPVLASLSRGTPQLMVLLGLHVVGHELSHVLACGLAGTRVREVGVMLYYGLIPMAYIDHTDSYRLQRPYQRASIALAGPFFDLLGAGVSAAIMLLSHGVVNETAGYFLLIQLTMLFLNANPFLPTDGYQALESLLGEYNMRRHAFSYVFAWVSRNSAHRLHVNTPFGRRCAYVIFTVVSGFMYGGLAVMWWRLFIGKGTLR